MEPIPRIVSAGASHSLAISRDSAHPNSAFDTHTMGSGYKREAGKTWDQAEEHEIWFGCDGTGMLVG